MKKKLTDLISIDNTLATPIYKQIVHSICRNIENGNLLQNDKLPSVNSISEKFSLARGSVFTAYNDLRASGIIDSIPGKGYFVTSTQTNVAQKIFLLFDAFTPYKEPLYNAIIDHLPKTSRLDIFFHHHNRTTFETLIREQAAYYTSFVIIPEIFDDTLSVLSQLEEKPVYLLDAGHREYKKYYPGVYQNVEKDIYTLLSNSVRLEKKYKRLFLLFPEGNRPKDMISGFNKFARSGTSISADIIHSIEEDTIRKGDAFIVVSDEHLVQLVELVRTRQWKPGKDIGILSCNENCLKQVIGEGISTISPDSVAMGRCIAEMITVGKRGVVENPFHFIDRQSF